MQYLGYSDLPGKCYVINTAKSHKEEEEDEEEENKIDPKTPVR